MTRLTPTPEPPLREALVEAREALKLCRHQWSDFAHEAADKAFPKIDSALSASPAEPEEATEAMVVQVIAQVLWEKVGPMISAPRAADIARDIYAALRSAASGGDTV